MDEILKKIGNAVTKRMLWFVLLFMVGLILYLVISGRPLIYKDRLQFGQAVENGEAIKDAFETTSTGAIGLEPNQVDKMFFKDGSCNDSEVRAALNTDASGNDQASICTCLEAEAGRGWYCFN